MRQKSSLLGITEGTHDYYERVKAYGHWLYRQRSKEGKSVLETINYVLYGGDINGLPLRIWGAIHEPKWGIAGLGVSSLGELVGWAMPEEFPPRNARTSKALRALGNNVKVHGY